MTGRSRFSNTFVNGYSHIGKARSRYYEDRIKFGQVPTRGGLSLTLGIVADGIGGENAGERAATLTADGVFDFCQASTETNIPEMLKAALVKVNTQVFHEAQQQRQKKNMGSTAAVAAICNNRLYVANVGDSRIYLVRDGKISQLTVDHTWEREVVQAHKLSAAEAARHPRRDELVRSIGYEATVAVDLGLYINSPNMSETEAMRAKGLQLQPGDQVVICSDGLVKSMPRGKGHFVEHPEIVKIVTEVSNEEAPRRLVEKALERNVDDNVSAIVMEVPDGKLSLPQLTHRLSSSQLAPVVVALSAILILGLVFIPRITNPTLSSGTPLPLVSKDQLYVSQLSNISLQVQSTNTTLSQVKSGSLLDFKNGQVLITSGSGYAQIEFPSQAEGYLAGGTEIHVKSPSDMQTEIDLVLYRGLLLINLPKEFPSGKRLLVETQNGAKAWVSGSMMGLRYDPVTRELYLDCLEDVCGYVDDILTHSLPQGYHVILKGSHVVSTGLGTQNELWQFIPGIVSTPTLTPTVTSTPTYVPEAKKPSNNHTSGGDSNPPAPQPPAPEPPQPPSGPPQPTCNKPHGHCK